MAEEAVVEDRGDDVAPPAKEPEKDSEEVAEQKTEEVAEKAEEAQEEEEPTSGQTIPFSRFRAQNLRLREAEKRAAELADQLKEMTDKQAASVPEPMSQTDVRDFDAEIAAAEKAMEAALTDNDTAAVLAAQREIRAVERAQYQHELEAVKAATAQTQSVLAEKAFDDTLSLIESEFPELDPTSSTHNPIKMALVQDLLRSYEGQGMASEDGLLRAVAMAYPDSELAGELLGTQSKEKKVAATEAKSATPRGVAAKLAAAKNLPPDLNAVGGENSDTAGMKSEIDVTKLSDEEFAALPSETRARLRGDLL